MAKYNIGNVTVEDFSEKVFDSIEKNLYRGVEAAISLYKVELQKEISEWGSLPMGGNKRLRVYHSNVDNPPLRQTSNLYNSIATDIKFKRRDNICGTVFTDVPYAPVLEQGGSCQIDQELKNHTTFRLINPFSNAGAEISKRPAWHKKWISLLNKMISLIANGG